MRTDSKLAIVAFAAGFLLTGLVPAHAQSQSDLAGLKQAIGYLRNNQGDKAIALTSQFKDQTAKDLVLWLGLRMTANDMGFDRAAWFVRERSNWPSAALIRRRAEKLLYDEKRPDATVRAFFGNSTPITGEGKLALAKALAAAGDTRNAAALVRAAWREDELSAQSERDLLDSFPSVLTRADHKARADRLFGNSRIDAAMRAAQLAGPDIAALGRARAAVLARSRKAGQLLKAVPATLHRDQGYIFASAQYYRRNDDPKAAARTFAEAPRDHRLIVDPDEWWRERRMVVRSLLDLGDPKTAYRVAHNAAPPESENYKADRLFTAGWIALRFLHDSASAKQLFAEILKVSVHPITVARAYYWLGRAYEAAGDKIATRLNYQNAAKHPVTYYGQLARARLGMKNLSLPKLSSPPAAELAAFKRQEPIRALQFLYAVSAEDLAVPIYTDYADRAGNDRTGYLMLAHIAREHHDARALVLIGKAAMSKGVPVAMIGFPTFGIPNYKHVGPKIDPAVVYAIARQESQFRQDVVSSANAHGLMQVIPSTARAIAKKFGLHWSAHKLGNDPTFNVQLGAAELGDLLESYHGNYVLTFIGYNAGRGRARQWIAKYGDPRDPKIDTVDWVERIPISETRFYVQRVMENLQVYQALAGGRRGLTIEADLTRGGMN